MGLTAHGARAPACYHGGMKNSPRSSISFLLLVFAFAAPAGAGSFNSSSLSALGRGVSVPDAPEALGAPVAAQAVAPSRSYQSLIYNNDGSARVIAPFFQNPTGEGALPLSSKSDHNGVCRLYGFGAVQASEAEGDYRRTAVIGIYGRLSGYREYDAYGAANPRLTEIYCGPSETSPRAKVTVEERVAAVHVNDDGSTTLVAPFVAGSGGERTPLTASGSLRGVCRYFGFQAYVASTSSGDLRKTVWIGADGKISGLRHYDAYGSANPRLDSIVCR